MIKGFRLIWQKAFQKAMLKPTQKQQRFYNWKRSFSLTKSTSEMPDNLSNEHLTKTESLQPLSTEWRRHNNT